MLRRDVGEIFSTDGWRQTHSICCICKWHLRDVEAVAELVEGSADAF